VESSTKRSLSFSSLYLFPLVKLDSVCFLQCGADFVKIGQGLPSGVEVAPNTRYASLDGDADRLLYYYTDAESKFHLLDGDKISSLYAAYLKELLEISNLNFSLGVVQTAYANGSSTSYLQDKMVWTLLALICASLLSILLRINRRLK